MKKKENKTEKISKKATVVPKKDLKPKFTVDLTKAECANDVFAQFAVAKQEAGLPMTDNEFNAVVLASSMMAVEALGEAINKVSKEIEIKNGDKLVFDSKGNFKVKKPNIFRRFWNWITRKNK